MAEERVKAVVVVLFVLASAYMAVCTWNALNRIEYATLTIPHP